MPFGAVRLHVSLGRSLLGQGRCPIALGRYAEAAPVLQQARIIFEGLHATPALALADIDNLLGEATALSS